MFKFQKHSLGKYISYIIKKKIESSSQEKKKIQLFQMEKKKSNFYLNFYPNFYPLKMKFI